MLLEVYCITGCNGSVDDKHEHALAQEFRVPRNYQAQDSQFMFQSKFMERALSNLHVYMRIYVCMYTRVNMHTTACHSGRAE